MPRAERHAYVDDEQVPAAGLPLRAAAGADLRSAGAAPGAAGRWEWERGAAAGAPPDRPLTAGSVLALQRLAGNRATGRYLTVQRCGSTPADQCGCHGAEEGTRPADSGGGTAQRQTAPVVQREPGAAGTPPNLGPPVTEVPRPPMVSVGRANGKWYWKAENVPGIGSTPQVPLNPADIPGEIDRLLKGAAKPGDGKQPPVDLPPVRIDEGEVQRWVATMCSRDSGRTNPLCLLNTPAPAPAGQPAGQPPGTAAPAPGVLWTDRITFQRDQPLPGAAGPGALTTAGQGALASVLSWLKLDPKLRVRLIGKASSEGDADLNQQLSDRRAQQIFGALSAAGFGDRVADPLPSDGQEAGCRPVGRGVWSCGATKASAEPDPEDRVVEVAFFHDLDLDLKLTPPTLLPR
jgi:outer membrane protein OmpA-like peptidoglycan-associated protein